MVLTSEALVTEHRLNSEALWYKLVHSYKILRRLRQEDPKLLACLGCRVNSKVAWTT